MRTPDFINIFACVQNFFPAKIRLPIGKRTPRLCPWTPKIIFHVMIVIILFSGPHGVTSAVFLSSKLVAQGIGRDRERALWSPRQDYKLPVMTGFHPGGRRAPPWGPGPRGWGARRQGRWDQGQKEPLGATGQQCKPAALQAGTRASPKNNDLDPR